MIYVDCLMSVILVKIRASPVDVFSPIDATSSRAKSF
jgi:hypothetical protein